MEIIKRSSCLAEEMLLWGDASPVLIDGLLGALLVLIVAPKHSVATKTDLHSILQSKRQFHTMHFDGRAMNEKQESQHLRIQQ